MSTRVFLVVFCTFALAQVARAETVAVVHVAGEPVQAELIAAVDSLQRVRWLAGQEVVRGLRELKWKGKDFARADRRAALLRKLRADALLSSRPQPGKRGRMLIELFDHSGQKVWSQHFAVVRKRGLEAGAQAEISAQLAALFPAPPVAAETAAPVASADEPEPSVSPPLPPMPEAEPMPTAGPMSTTGPMEPISVAEPPVASTVPLAAASADGEGERFALLDVRAGPAAFWRTYRFCPGVAACGQKSHPADGTPLVYQTRAPYLGPWVEARVHPFRDGRGLLAGLGLMGRYSQGFVQTQVIGAGSAGTQWSTDQGFGLALLYAHAFHQVFAQPQIAFALGVHHRMFAVASNPVLPSSARQLAPEASFEGRMVLVRRWASLRVRAGAIFFAEPGREERALFGEQSVSGWGATAAASLEGQLPGSQWGYALNVNHVAFFDRFEGSGLVASGGAAVEQYSSMALFTRYAF